MKKTFTLLQLFSILDGRLSTSIDDIYDMLNHICDCSLMTHHLPSAMKYLRLKNPKWYQDQLIILNSIKRGEATDNFEALIGAIKLKYVINIEIPQLKDEFDTSDFGDFMIYNSLLNK